MAGISQIVTGLAEETLKETRRRKVVREINSFLQMMSRLEEDAIRAGEIPEGWRPNDPRLEVRRLFRELRNLTHAQDA